MNIQVYGSRARGRDKVAAPQAYRQPGSMQEPDEDVKADAEGDTDSVRSTFLTRGDMEQMLEEVTHLGSTGSTAHAPAVPKLFKFVRSSPHPSEYVVKRCQKLDSRICDGHITIQTFKMI